MRTDAQWDQVELALDAHEQCRSRRNLTSTERDESRLPTTVRSRPRRSGDIKATANGNLFTLPAGDASTTITLGGSTVTSTASSALPDVDQLDFARPDNAARRRSTSTLPISRNNRDFSALGNLTLNGNAEVDQLSDFGTLTTLGAGANWSPVDRLNFVTSWTREEGPPTINQLGDPVLVTPGTRIFDFVTGRPFSSPRLRAAIPIFSRTGATCSSSAATGSRSRKPTCGFAPNMFIRRSTDPISNLTRDCSDRGGVPDHSFATTRASWSASTCGRSISKLAPRHAAGRLRFLEAAEIASAVTGGDRPDARAIPRPGGSGDGGAGSHRRTGSPTSPPATARRRGRRAAGRPGSDWPAASRRASAAGAPAARRLRRAAVGGRGGEAAASSAAATAAGCTFSLTDTITFVDKVQIAPGMPELDYLHGDAAGQSGGTPRHNVQAQAGYFNNGLGARIGGQLAQRDERRTR